MNPLVSICIPVYNVAPYIERCVRSLMEQDYDNLEYVFVNDDSTDDSVKLLEQVVAEYPQRSSAVHVYHNDRNHGVAYTRQISIENATGEYVACVDSDDWVDKNYISSMVEQAGDDEVDLVIAPVKEHTHNQTTILRDQLVCDTFFADCVLDNVGHLWGKLICKEIFAQHACYAPEGLNYLEDRIALLQIAYYTHKVVCIDKVFYHYVHQQQSITATKTDFHFDCLIRYWQEAERLMREWGVWERYADICKKQQVENKIALMLQCTSNQTRRKYADLYRENEIANLKDLLPGFQLMGRLVHYHLWPLISLYQIYIDMLNKRKNN